MKVAIIHDWLVAQAGAERVLEQMLRCFPQAELYSTVDFIPPEKRGFLLDKPARTTFIQKLPFARGKYRSYLPLMPFAVEQFDLSGYDLIISSSHAVAKGVLTGPDQLHVCMCYTPIRYAWDLQHLYLREGGLKRGLKSMAARWLLHRIRQWDFRTAAGVDEFIAISRFIERRIRKVYRRSSTVIYPPVNIAGLPLREEKEDFYLAVSRLTPYKRMDLIAEAFSAMPGKKLVVIGEGPELAKVRAKAGPNVTVLGRQEFPVLRDHLQRARAFVFAAEEDFGIAPLEAQACGTPVIAYGKGGALETVRGPEQEGATGLFFPEQTVSSLTEAVHAFEACRADFTPAACRANAERFGEERFREEFAAFVRRAQAAFAQQEQLP